MIYSKHIDEIGAVSISTLNADGEGNITGAEYAEILALLRAMPDGKILVDTGEGYEYADAPQDDDIPAEEALDILMGVSE